MKWYALIAITSLSLGLIACETPPQASSSSEPESAYAHHAATGDQAVATPKPAATASMVAMVMRV